MLIILIGGSFLLLIIFFIFINKFLNIKKQLYTNLYDSVLSFCKSTVAKNITIEEITNECIEEGIDGDNQIQSIIKKLHEVMYERDNKLHLKVSKSNIPILLSNIIIVISKYRTINNITTEQENKIFDIIYDCIKKPNIGLIVITRELNTI